MHVIVDAEPRVVELSPEEGRELFERASQRLMGLSAQEFVDRYEAGEFGNPDDDPRVLRLSMLIPFWQAGRPTRPSTSS